MKKGVIYFVGVLLCIVSIYSFYLTCFPIEFESYVNESSSKWNVNPALVLAIIKAESNFDERALSRAGAKGVMQLMEQTAEFVAEKYNISIKGKDYLYNAKINIELGCAYLNYLFEKFKNISIVICAYNAGEGRVQAWLKEGIIDENNFKLIPFKETKTYLNKVLFNYQNYTNRLKYRMK